MSESHEGEPVVPKADQWAITGSSGFAIGDYARIKNVDTQVINVAAVPQPSWPMPAIGDPPALAPAFQARPAIADALERAFIQHHPVILLGPGGVGKTQLATMAFHIAESNGLDLLIWVDASDVHRVLEGLARARTVVDPRLEDLVRSPDASVAARELVNWLSTTKQSWILVLDGLDDPQALDCLGGLGDHLDRGRLLITTHNRMLEYCASARIDVGVFSPDEANAYLRTRLGSDADVLDDEGLISEALGFLPVALAQAAAVLKHQLLRNATTGRQYLTLLRDRTRRLEEVLPSKARAEPYRTQSPATSAATLIALDAADRLQPVGLASQALRLGSVTDPAGCPAALWMSEAGRAYLAVSAFRQEAVSEDDAYAAVRNLHTLSLINHDPGNGSEVADGNVKVHMLTQRSILDRMSAEGQDQVDIAVRAAADALGELLIEEDLRIDGVLTLLRNAQALCAVQTDVLVATGIHPTLTSAGHKLGDFGRGADARDYFAQLLHRVPLSDTASRLMLRHNVAFWAAESGEADSALEELRRVRDLYTSYFGEDHPNSTTIRVNLALLQVNAGLYEEAIPNLERLLGERVTENTRAERLNLKLRVDLAFARCCAGDSTAARVEFEELLDDLDGLGDSEIAFVLESHAKYAVALAFCADGDAAIKVFNSVIGRQMEIFGQWHRATLVSRVLLSGVFAHSGQYDVAADMARLIAYDSAIVYGAVHPDTFRARYNTAQWTGNDGHHREAVDMFAMLSSDLLAAYGIRHQLTVASYMGLGVERGYAGYPEDAVNILEKVVPLADVLFGARHRNAIAARNNLAFWRIRAGDAELAGQELKALLAISIEALGSDDPMTRTIGANLGPAGSEEVAGNKTAETNSAFDAPARSSVQPIDNESEAGSVEATRGMWTAELSNLPGNEILTIGQRAFRQGLLDESTFAFAVAADDPDELIAAYAICDLGIVAAARGNLGEAVAHYETVVARFGNDVRADVRVRAAQAACAKEAIIAQQRGPLDAAEVDQELTRRFGSDPNSEVRAVVARAMVDKEIMLSDAGDASAALAVCERIGAQFLLDPSTEVRGEVARALTTRGDVLHKLGESAEAIVAWDDVLERFADETTPATRATVAAAMTNKGIALAGRGRWGAAIAIYDEVIAQYSDDTDSSVLTRVVGATFSKAVALRDAGDIDAGVIALDQVVARFGNETAPAIRDFVAMSLYLKGNMRAKGGEATEAIAVFDEVAARFGFDTADEVRASVVQSMVNKAVLLADSGDGAGAVAAYDDVISRFGDDEALVVREPVTKALLNKLIVLAKKGAVVQAGGVCDAVLSRFGDGAKAMRSQIVTALVDRAVELSNQQNLAAAVAVLEIAVSRLGRDTADAVRVVVARAFLHKGAMLMQIGDAEGAVVAFEEMASRYGTDPADSFRLLVAQSLVNRGIILLAQTRVAEAVTLFDSAIAEYGHDARNEIRFQAFAALINKGIVAVQYEDPQGWEAVVEDVTTRFGSDYADELHVAVSAALVNRAMMLGQQDDPDGEIALCDLVIAKFGTDNIGRARAAAAAALLFKGVSFGERGSEDLEIAAYDEIVARFGADAEVEVRTQVALALYSKGVTLGEMGNLDGEIEVYNEIRARYSRDSDAAILEILDEIGSS